MWRANGTPWRSVAWCTSRICATAAAYEWDALIEALGEAVATRDTWAKLAGLAPEEAMGPSGAVAGDTPDDWLEAELFRKAG
jgi:hypothetical protein